MKKIQIFALVALAMLVAVSCSKSKSSDEPVSDAPVCKTLELHVDWELSKDITDNFNVVLATTDFNGNAVSDTLRGIKGSSTFTKEDANIDNKEDNWPFTLRMDVAEAEGAVTTGNDYSAAFKVHIYAVFKDAAGKELYTGSKDSPTKDTIREKDYSDAFNNFENLKKYLEKNLKVEEETYVFFRGQSVVSGEYFFSHSTK